jgi:hypothetical protein
MKISALPLGRSAYPLFPVVTTPGAKWGGSGDFHDNQHTPHATPGGLAEGSRGMANRCAVLQYLDRRFKGSWVPATAASVSADADGNGSSFEQFLSIQLESEPCCCW